MKWICSCGAKSIPEHYSECPVCGAPKRPKSKPGNGPSFGPQPPEPQDWDSDGDYDWGPNPSPGGDAQE